MPKIRKRLRAAQLLKLKKTGHRNKILTNGKAYIMDWINLTKFAVALLFVLSLMGGLAFVLRYFDQRTGGLTLPGRSRDDKRLAIIERLTLDRQKTALILRIDDRDYLVISGPNGDTVVECKHSDGKIVSFENKTEPKSGTAEPGGHPRQRPQNILSHTAENIPE